MHNGIYAAQTPFFDPTPKDDRSKSILIPLLAKSINTKSSL